MEIGGVYGKFQVRREIAHGGMGVLYEAWDTLLNRRVALKAIHAQYLSNPTFVQQFLIEAQSAAAVEHPNIIHIHGIEQLDGRTVIDMEYVDGTPLSELLSFGPLTPFHTVEILLQILDALSACHQCGIVHCDIKPSNIIITPQGRAMLTDFGLAAAMKSMGESGSKLPWGTPAYSPPEAWTGGPVAPTWDIYCAGVVAYECITGHVPRMGTSLDPSKSGDEVVTRISLAARQGPPESISVEGQVEGIGTLEEIPAVLSMTSPELDKIVQSMLALDPATRPQDAAELLCMLRHTSEATRIRLGTPPVPAPSALPEERRRKPPGPYLSLWQWLALAILAGLLSGALTSTGVLLIQSGDEKPGMRSEASSRSVAPAFSSSPENLTISGGFVYFSADDGVHGRELFAGEPGGGKVHLMKDLVPGPDSSNPHGLQAYRGGVIFVADTPDTGTELWWGGWSVGNEFSIRLIKDIVKGRLGTNPEVVAVLGTVVLSYASTPDYGRELWSSMGEAETTAMVMDVFSGAGGSVPTAPRVAQAGDIAYIVALTDVGRGNCLWRYHATDNSLTMISDVSEDTQYQTILGDRVVFPQTDAAHGNELWFFDAESSSATLLADLIPGPVASHPTELFAWKNCILFQASTTSKGRELWRTDGTENGTLLVQDIAKGPDGCDPYAFVAGDEGVYFSADDHVHGRELWITDGSEAGTLLIADVRPGAASSGPYNIVPCLGGGVLFSADDGLHGEELWHARLGAEGWQAQLVEDVYPGPASSEPFGLCWEGPTVGVFSATAPEIGRELYLVRINDGQPKIELYDDLYLKTY